MVKSSRNIVTVFLLLNISITFDVTLGFSRTVNKNDTRTKMEGKIVGGQPVPIEWFPFAVILYNKVELCAGSILNSWTVLTAAHCIETCKNVTELELVAGGHTANDTDGYLHNAVHLLIHHKYDTVTLVHDIALVFVSNEFHFGKRVQKAVIVNHPRWMDEDEIFIVSGWGRTEEHGSNTFHEGLKMTTLEYVDEDDCERMNNWEMHPSAFCLYRPGGYDACVGDSGGGVIWRRYLVGVVSFGFGCAKPNAPAVYTNVWYFRRWIMSSLRHFVTFYCENRRKFRYFKNRNTPKK